MDGKEVSESLFESIMRTQEKSNPNNVIKFSDNSRCLPGTPIRGDGNGARAHGQGWIQTLTSSGLGMGVGLCGWWPWLGCSPPAPLGQGWGWGSVADGRGRFSPASAIQGRAVCSLWPRDPSRPSRFEKRTSTRHVIFTAETHNFPTGQCRGQEGCVCAGEYICMGGFSPWGGMGAWPGG